MAASELPPPTPPCIGRRFCTSIATPASSDRAAPRAGALRGHQVRLGRHAGQLADPLDDAGGRSPEAKLVAEVDELERRLQQVIAVGAPPDDVQEQVQLAGRGPRLGPAERLAPCAQVPLRRGLRASLPVVHDHLDLHRALGRRETLVAARHRLADGQNVS